MYKFLKIETWTIGDVVKPREGVVSMEDVARSRAQSAIQPRIVPLPDEDEDGDNDSDDSDKKSKMSFSYWSADKTTVQKTVVKGKPGVAATRRGTPVASYGRESSANAKFGTRLVFATRPASRRTMNSTPAGRRPSAPPASEDTPNYARATITRSLWDSSTKPIKPGPNLSAGHCTTRKRNTSLASSATKATVTSHLVIAGLAPLYYILICTVLLRRYMYRIPDSLDLSTIALRRHE